MLIDDLDGYRHDEDVLVLHRFCFRVGQRAEDQRLDVVAGLDVAGHPPRSA